MDKRQIIGLLILLLTLGGIMLVVNLLPTAHHGKNPLKTRKWDSIQVARQDSAKAYWDSVKVARRDSAKAYWDSVKVARKDSAKAYWDSVRQVRKDSLYPYTSIPLHPKKDTVLDLNSADTTELQYLRGIGPYVAKRIVDYRRDLGGYASVEQVREIDVLCRYDQNKDFIFTFDSILPHLVANRDSIRKMPVNRMSAGALSKHPYLRFDQAKSIYELRRRKFNLKSIEDIRPVVGDSICAKLEPYLDFTSKQ